MLVQLQSSFSLTQSIWKEDKSDHLKTKAEGTIPNITGHQDLKLPAGFVWEALKLKST
jgi:hypothetical protein